MNLIRSLKEKARVLRREVFVMYLALRHPQTPWYAKAIAAMVILYAASPIDLIPDFVPVLGYLDDLIIVPLGVLVVRKMIPAVVLEECRLHADNTLPVGEGWKRAGVIIIILIWVIMLAATAGFIWHFIYR